MIDPNLTHKIINLIMESSVSALVAGLLIGGLVGAGITVIVSNKKNACDSSTEI